MRDRTRNRQAEAAVAAVRACPFTPGERPTGSGACAWFRDSLLPARQQLSRAMAALRLSCGMVGRRSLELWVRLFCREAVRALLRHKLRSGLTTLGIAIGVTGVVLVVAVGQAGTERAQEALQQLG